MEDTHPVNVYKNRILLICLQFQPLNFKIIFYDVGFPLKSLHVRLFSSRRKFQALSLLTCLLLDSFKYYNIWYSSSYSPDVIELSDMFFFQICFERNYWNRCWMSPFTCINSDLPTLSNRKTVLKFLNLTSLQVTEYLFVLFQIIECF